VNAAAAKLIVDPIKIYFPTEAISSKASLLSVILSQPKQSAETNQQYIYNANQDQTSVNSIS
jgi:hypothetical protein